MYVKLYGCFYNDYLLKPNFFYTVGGLIAVSQKDRVDTGTTVSGLTFFLIWGLFTYFRNVLARSR